MAHLIRPRYTNGDGKTRKTAKWYGVIRDPATGKNRRVPLCEDKTAAKAMLADLLRNQDRAAAGITAKPVWPLAASIDDWRASMQAGGAKAKTFAGVTNVEQALAGWNG